MTCIEKLPHEDCGSSNALQVFYNEKQGFHGWCFSCQTFVPNPYSDGKDPPEIKKKTDKEIKEEILEIKRLPVFNTKYRGIPIENWKKWGVRLSISEYDGKTPFAIWFGYQRDNKLVGWKAINLKKKMFWGVGVTKDVDPFGWSRALRVGAKTLYITEGEFDAIALDHILHLYNSRSKYRDKQYSIISLSHGANSVTKDLKRIKDKIKTNFEQVVLLFDNDEQGKKAEKEAQKLLPNVLRADQAVGCKDANDALMNNQVEELAKNVLWNCHKPPIKGVVSIDDVIDRAMEEPKAGLSYPFVQFDEMTLGQRFGELVSIGGGVGTGKTLLAHEFAAHNMIFHKLPCFMVLLEEQNPLSLRNIAGKIDSIPYHVPDTKYDVGKFRETCLSLKNKLFLWESDEDQAMRFDLDEIIDAIRFNAQEYGVKFVYIDNMTRLVDHLTTQDANEFINKYSSVLENLSTQLNINITVFSHLNPNKDVPHESGGQVLASQFTGSRGLMRSSPMMIGFERNKHAKGDKKNNSYLTVIKNRKYGLEGKVKTQYSRATGKLKEVEWEGDTLQEDY